MRNVWPVLFLIFFVISITALHQRDCAIRRYETAKETIEQCDTVIYDLDTTCRLQARDIKMWEAKNLALAEQVNKQKQWFRDTIQVILAEHTDQWMEVPGVVGTAIGEFDGQPCIKIFVVKKTDELAEIPSSVNGHLIVIEETGEFQALSIPGCE